MLAAAVAVLAFGAVAQTAQPSRVRGTIEKIEGQHLAVKAREGGTIDIKLADNVAVTGVVKAKLADIAVGNFVGIAALPQKDGSLKAIEVLIFPEAARGSNEGHYAWDLMPESTMTNATVAERVSGVDGPVLTLKYKDGETKIVVPPEAPIVTFAAGDRTLLKPGAGVFVPAMKQPNGGFTAARILVGKDGVMPPM
jgi:outer membrane lipoprotein SlyB